MIISQTEIDKLIEDIVEGYNPEKIYLFGSYVNGTPNADSDLDLLVIKSTTLRRKDRIEQILNSLKSYPNIGVDFIIYTPEELESVKNDVVNIAKEAVNTGKLLYERV
jgi:predicted nucleotidyltransferase